MFMWCAWLDSCCSFFVFLLRFVCLFLNEAHKTMDVQCFILPFLECMAEMLLRILKIFRTTQNHESIVYTIHIVLCPPVPREHVRFAGIHLYYALCVWVHFGRPEFGCYGIFEWIVAAHFVCLLVMCVFFCINIKHFFTPPSEKEQNDCFICS